MQQSTQGAELNSEATLNCKGKDFKCVDLTHYQSCSLTERTGQESQWTINGVVFPCLAGQSCSDDSQFSCGVARTVPSSDEPIQIPVEITIVSEPIVKPEEETAPAKSLPVDEPIQAIVPTEAVVVAPIGKNFFFIFHLLSKNIQKSTKKRCNFFIKKLN